MKRLTILAVLIGATAWSGPRVLAFCGFYVAKADTKLFNKASQVVLVRDGDRTVMTMANDFRGDPKEFAIVIPVPTVLQRDQISVADKAQIDHVDAYTAPRLVEYFDENPCVVRPPFPMARARSMPMDSAMRGRVGGARSLGVTIEARYTVGEYDILILSATQSSGLETWLRTNGYRIPAGASAVLNSYIRQNMKFFVAKVNLKEQASLGFTYLRPIQISYTSPKFMLPIRLGTVNADGAQELFVFALTRKGRVETTNYRTVKLPSDVEIPVFVKSRFGDFYKAMFSRQVQKENMRVVFLEYAWDMAWCDPCAADPLTTEELRKLGVFWLGGSETLPARPGVRPVPMPGGPQNVFVTRLHVRYDNEHFPEDLVFQETPDRDNFQGRYVLRHPWKDDGSCRNRAAVRYKRDLELRQEREAQTLASLTGWDINDVRRQMAASEDGR